MGIAFVPTLLKFCYKLLIISKTVYSPDSSANLLQYTAFFLTDHMKFSNSSGTTSE